MIFALTVHKYNGSYKGKEKLMTEEAFCATVKHYYKEFLEDKDVLNDYDALARNIETLLNPFVLSGQVEARVAINDFEKIVFVVRNIDNERLLTFKNTGK